MNLSSLIDGVIFECEIDNISTDTQKCDKGTLLFLLNENDKKRLKNNTVNASVIVYQGNNNFNFNGIKIKAENIRQTLSMAYKRFCCDDLSGIKFIGITGTNGKSTTAIFLKKILTQSRLSVGLFGTGKILLNDIDLTAKNYSMTTPPPEILYPKIRQMKDMGAQIIIMEVSSHALAQERVYPINFETAVFTNLSRDHLDYHKSLIEYFSAKEKLFFKSKNSVINTDDKHGQKLLSTLHNSCYSVGFSALADAKITDTKDMGFSGVKFTYSSGSKTEQINLKLPGIYNAYNASLAIKAAETLTIALYSSKKALESIDKIDGRYNIINDEITVVIDYAHTEVAFCSFLESLFINKKARQKITVVFGCGGNRDKYKRYTMGAFADQFADKIVLTSDNPRNENPLKIIRDIASAMKSEPTIIEDRDSAIKYAIENTSDGDIVAIIGKGPEKYIINNNVFQDFDEEKIIFEALNKRKSKKQ